MTLAHTLTMTPAVAKKAMTVWQDAYPSRPKAMHFINFPPVMESIYKMVTGFQKEKMRQRNHIHRKGNYCYTEVNILQLQKMYNIQYCYTFSVVANYLLLCK